MSETASVLALVWDFYARQSGARDALTGVAILVLGSLGIWKYGDLAASPIFAAMALGGSGMALAPAGRGLRARFAFKQGRPTLAKVLSLQDITRSRVTLGALTNGWAQGVRIVTVEQASFEDEFATDEPGARDIKEGSIMRVLVHRERSEVLLELGLAELSDR